MIASSRNQHGFTLIELSIVIVIIALILGGILVGRDLILAAQVRMTIADLESYETAVHTFKNKYKCLPGDCATATEFGFTQDCTNLSSGCGDGVVEGNFINTAGGVDLYQESLDFWAQLSQANLVAGKFTGYTTYLAPIRAGQEVPVTRLNNKAMVWVSGEYDAGLSRAVAPNYFWLGEVVTDSGSNSAYYAGALIPLHNFLIDSKIDDGKPDSGKARMGLAFRFTVLEGTGTYGTAGVNSNYCATNTTPAEYNVRNITPFANYGAGLYTTCFLSLQTSF